MPIINAHIHIIELAAMAQRSPDLALPSGITVLKDLEATLPMGRLSRWRHRVNLHRTAGKPRWLLPRHRFGSFRQAMPSLPSSAKSEYHSLLRRSELWHPAS
jgi:hypothetical protein